MRGGQPLEGLSTQSAAAARMHPTHTMHPMHHLPAGRGDSIAGLVVFEVLAAKVGGCGLQAQPRQIGAETGLTLARVLLLPVQSAASSLSSGPKAPGI